MTEPQRSDKLCHMPALTMKRGTLYEQSRKTKGFSRWQLQLCRKRDAGAEGGMEKENTRGFSRCGELLLQPEARHKRALRALPTALPRRF